MKYDFEEYFLNEVKPVNKYYVWSDKNDDGTRANNWATGNPGYNLSVGNTAKPTPTLQFLFLQVQKAHWMVLLALN